MSDEEKFIIARWTYAIGADFISDIEYDHLEQIMKASGRLEEFTNRGWSEDRCPFELLRKYKLDEYIVPAVFTHATESIESLNSVELVESRYRGLNQPTRLSYKCDGWSLRLSYYNGRLVLASCRNRNEGRALILDKLYPLFQQRIPLMGKVLITGELYLVTKSFKEYRRMRGIVSQRNGVSSAIANGDVEFLGYRCYNIYYEGLDNNTDKYRLLQDMGFKVPKFVMVNNYAQLIKAIEVLGRTKETYDTPSDGLVAENATSQFAIRIGAWEEKTNMSYVVGYTFNRGMYGNAVLVKIRPMFVNQKEVREISVTNLQTIIDNKLNIGSPIVFVERSAVNSIIDTTKTADVQQAYYGNYDEYRKNIDEIAVRLSQS